MNMSIQSQLNDAIFEENFESVAKFISDGVNINFVDEQGESPLLIAIETNNETLVLFLLKNGAFPNLENTFTPSLHAAIDISVEATKNNDDVTDDSTKIIELLLKYGANPLIKNKNGVTAIDFARGYHLPAQKLFEEYLRKQDPSKS